MVNKKQKKKNVLLNTKIWILLLTIIIVFGIYYLYTFNINNKNNSVEEYINIGYIGPLTGDIAFIGKDQQRVIDLAVEEINREGGVLGRKIRVIYEDGKCNGQDAIFAANKLINIDKVKYIIGGQCSSETLAIAPIAEQAKVILLSPISSNPEITNAGDYIFRLYPSDVYEGKIAANYVYYELGLKEAAILSCINEACLGLKETFIKEYQNMGGEIIIQEMFGDNSDDFKSELVKIKQKNPEIIYTLSYPKETVNILEQASQLNLNTIFLGSNMWDDISIWNKTGKIADGNMYLVSKSDINDEFKRKFAIKYGDTPIGPVSAQAYDVLNIFKLVIEKGKDNVDDVKNELYKIKNYQGVSNNNIEFDINGDLKYAEYNIMIIKDGKPEIIS